MRRASAHGHDFRSDGPGRDGSGWSGPAAPASRAWAASPAWWTPRRSAARAPFACDVGRVTALQAVEWDAWCWKLGGELDDLGGDPVQGGLVLGLHRLDPLVDPAADQLHLRWPHPAAGHRGRAQPDAGGVERLSRVVGDGVVVGDQPGAVQALRGRLALDPLLVRSMSSRWLSVPPDTRSNPRSASTW